MKYLIFGIILLCSSVNAEESQIKPCSYEEELPAKDQIAACFFHDQARGMRKLWLGSKKDKAFMASGFQQFSAELAQKLKDANGPERSRLLLYVMRVINELHDDPREIRFPVLDMLSFADLTELVVRWRAPLYTSSYNEIVDRLIRFLEDDAEMFSGILKAMSPEYQAIFLEASGSWGRLKDFLKILPAQVSTELMSTYFETSLTTASIKDCIVLAEGMLLPEMPETLRALLLQRIGTRLLELSSPSAGPLWLEGYRPHPVQSPMLAAVRVMAESWIHYASEEARKRYRGFTAEIAALLNTAGVERMKRPRLLDGLELLGPDRTIHEKHIYFDDADGRATFHVFMEKYRKVLNWNTQEEQDYVRISQMNPFSGIKVDMLVNRPHSFPHGSEVVDEVFRSQNLYPHVFVFRGHSYHVSECVDHILPGTRLVLIGSCGGVENLARILTIAPQADLILTRGIGTVWINNILVRMLNELLLNAEVIPWQEFRQRVRDQLVERLEGYELRDRVIMIYDDYYLFPNEHPAQAMMRLWLSWFPQEEEN